jgi:hypothetical protein
MWRLLVGPASLKLSRARSENGGGITWEVTFEKWAIWKWSWFNWPRIKSRTGSDIIGADTSLSINRILFNYLQLKAWIQLFLVTYITVGYAKGVSDGIEKIRHIQILHIRADTPQPRDDLSVVKLLLVHLIMLLISQIVWNDRMSIEKWTGKDVKKRDWGIIQGAILEF